MCPVCRVLNVLTLLHIFISRPPFCQCVSEPSICRPIVILGEVCFHWNALESIETWSHCIIFPRHDESCILLIEYSKSAWWIPYIADWILQLGWVGCGAVNAFWNIWWGEKWFIIMSALIMWYSVLDKLLAFPNKNDIDGLVQERRNSSALTMVLNISCTNPSIWTACLEYNCYINLYTPFTFYNTYHLFLLSPHVLI